MKDPYRYMEPTPPTPPARTFKWREVMTYWLILGLAVGAWGLIVYLDRRLAQRYASECRHCDGVRCAKNRRGCR